MNEPKYKKKDKIRILRNEIEKQYVGKEGTIHRVYQTFSDNGEYSYCYRVNVGGRLLKGVANTSDIEKI